MNKNLFFIVSLILYSSALFAVESNVSKQSDDKNGPRNPNQVLEISEETIHNYNALISNVQAYMKEKNKENIHYFPENEDFQRGIIGMLLKQKEFNLETKNPVFRRYGINLKQKIQFDGSLQQFLEKHENYAQSILLEIQMDLLRMKEDSWIKRAITEYQKQDPNLELLDGMYELAQSVLGDQFYGVKL